MKYIPILVFVLLSLLIKAQDPHFTQFYSAPLTLNPALTGAFQGKYRLSAIYRDQWRSVLDKPYVTFSSGIDLRFGLDNKSRYKDAAGVGLMFFTDKVNEVEFSTSQISLSGAYHKSLDQSNLQYLSLGFQASVAQRNVIYQNLTFGDQFNGEDGYTFDSAENLPENNFTFGDFAVGLNYSYSPKRRMAFFAGAALHHFLQPNVSFYSPEQNMVYEDNKLLLRISGQVSASLPLNALVTLVPRVMVAKQGSHLEANSGTNFRIALNDYSSFAMHIGGWVRTAGNESDEFFVDAIIAMFGIEFKNVLFGFSYDINLKNLSSYRNGQGALEFSIAYLGEYENEAILCPKF